MALPLEERIAIAQALWESIDEGLSDGGERDAIEQALRCDADLTSGAVIGRTHGEVMASMRRAMGCD